MRLKYGKPFIERHTIAIYFVITFLITIILGAAYQFTNNAFVISTCARCNYDNSMFCISIRKECLLTMLQSTSFHRRIQL
ncbi:hypothetical protein BI350_07320 [Sporosarcina ureilytica]|uniref:Uncharacterized protein n=1 Tax=Sporosarcina ureilytica TaxID=298596 RepID=A0A1D8JF73_9BACL|nr:hypothetical protein BI350_07320 [Sporosarcina ureilytica]